jgi:hypothetical protein
MSLHPQSALPRPEDRRRGELERLMGCVGAQGVWRSEAFAEDLPPPAPASADAQAPDATAWLRRPRAWWAASQGMTLQPGR